MAANKKAPTQAVFIELPAILAFCLEGTPDRLRRGAPDRWACSSVTGRSWEDNNSSEAKNRRFSWRWKWGSISLKLILWMLINFLFHRHSMKHENRSFLTVELRGSCQRAQTSIFALSPCSSVSGILRNIYVLQVRSQFPIVSHTSILSTHPKPNSSQSSNSVFKLQCVINSVSWIHMKVVSLIWMTKIPEREWVRMKAASSIETCQLQPQFLKPGMPGHHPKSLTPSWWQVVLN